MVGKVNRNDLCPCGSGKKYKHCCGGKEAVSITSLLEREVEHLQAQIIAQADFLYGETMDDDFAERVAPSLIDDVDEIEFFSFIHTIWYTLFHPLPEGITILEEFIQQQAKQPMRPALRQVLESWTNPRPVVGRLLSLDPNQVVIRDILTEDELVVKLLTPVTAPEKATVFGFLVPFRDEHIFFPTFFDMECDPELKDEFYLKGVFAESGYDDPMEFLKEEIIDVINEMQYLSFDINTDHFEWPLPVHKKVADRVVADLRKVEAPDELTGTALLLWNRYCQLKPKQIKNVGLYSAALQFVAMNIHPFVFLEVEEFAVETGVSSSSLCKVVSDLQRTLEPELEELHEAITQDLDGMDDDDLLDWFDWEDDDDDDFEDDEFADGGSDGRGRIPDDDLPF